MEGMRLGSGTVVRKILQTSRPEMKIALTKDMKWNQRKGDKIEKYFTGAIYRTWWLMEWKWGGVCGQTCTPAGAAQRREVGGCWEKPGRGGIGCCIGILLHSINVRHSLSVFSCGFEAYKKSYKIQTRKVFSWEESTKIKFYLGL